MEINGQSYTLEEEDGFVLMHPDSISCQLVSCKHHKICSSVGKNPRILSIPQSVQSVPSPSRGEYSQSVFEKKSIENHFPMPEGDFLGQIVTGHMCGTHMEKAHETEEFFIKADWPLVGVGVEHASCGSFWTHLCLEKHDSMELPETVRHQKRLDGKCQKDGVFVQRVKMSCHRPICPKCWQDWRARQVAKVKPRFEAMEKTFNRHQLRHLKRCHGTISVPKALWHLSVPSMKKLALKYLKELGIAGGTIIYHPRRERHRKRGDWYFSPHFHVYFHAWNGWIDGEMVTKFSRRTGWVFRNFGERPLSKSISYQLSHAGVPPDHGHIVTWFGSMNYRLLHVEKWHGEPQKCPWGHKMDRYGIYVGKDPAPALPEEDGYVAYIAREGWIYLPKSIKQRNLGDG